jgi:mono/diheme cytochrome c family protein
MTDMLAAPGFNHRHFFRPALRLAIMLLFLVQTSAPLAANPVPYDAASVERGAQTYQRYCTECHGRDGRAQMDVISDATDLTDPEAYYNGSTEQDIHTSIAQGAGVGMPPWQAQLKTEEAIWDLVNFIRSLWSEEQRASH